MKINIPNEVYEYFGSEAKLIDSVNKVGAYFNFEKFKKSLEKVSISEENTSLINVDESKLDNEALKDSKILVMIAIYALGVGE